MNGIKLCLVSVVILLIVCGVVSVSSCEDVYPAVDARSISMGSVVVAGVRGAGALYWNPACMVFEKNWNLIVNSGSSSTWGSEQFLGVTRSLLEYGVLGLGFHRKKFKNAEGDSVGIILGFASPVVENEMALGVTFQVFSSIEGVKGFRISMGFHYRPFEKFSFGTVAFSRSEYEGSTGNKVQLPFYARTGVMYSPNQWVSVGADVELSRKGKRRGPGELGRVSYGVEFDLPVGLIWSEGTKMIDIKVRAGTRSGFTELGNKFNFHWKRPWDEGGLNVGFEMKLKFLSPVVSFNYANDEKERNFVGLSVNF